MPNNTGPSPFWTGIIGAAGGVVGTAANAIWQGAMNKKTRKWNEKMYGRQRADALTDWNMQNEYNSPAAQMERYKAAGLNPNLIYGQSNESGAIRSSDSGSWNPRAPEIDLSGIGGNLKMVYDIVQTQAQTNKTLADAEVARQQQKLIEENVKSVSQSIKGAEFDLGQRMKLGPINVEMAQASLDKQLLDMGLSVDANTRANLLASKSVAEMTARIAQMQIQNAKTDAERRNIEEGLYNILQSQEMNELDLKLKRMGVQPGDNMIFRAAIQLWDKLKNMRGGNFLKGLKGN